MTQSLFIRRYSNRFLSRWLVLAIDVIITIFSFLVATALRLNFRYEELHFDVFIYHFIFLLSIRFITFLYFKTYSGIIRHTSIEDAVLILKTIFTGTMVAAVISLAIRYFLQVETLIYVPISILVIDFFICLVLSVNIVKKYFISN